MQKSSSSEGLLIVVELGAEWPSLSGAEAARPTGSRRVLAQDESESHSAFAARVGEQLHGLFARGVALGHALIACSERTDAPARASRSELARATASALAGARGGSLVLVAVDRNEGRSQKALSALQAELAREWLSAAIDVTLRFGADAPAESLADPKSRTRAKRVSSQDGKAGSRRVA